MAALAAALLLAGCHGGQGGAPGLSAAERAAGLVPVGIETQNGVRWFKVELADTVPEQAQGLMYRTDLRQDGGMLFRPYPPEGGGPREASFWMANTPSSLDILFIRADDRIASIAEQTVPLSETPIESGEPVAAVLEVPAGRVAALGIRPGDRVILPPR